MSNEDRDKWNNRYAEGAYVERGHPSVLLTRWAGEGAGKRALDVACGAGRNAVYLAANGCTVQAVDVSSVAVGIGRRRAESQGLRVDFVVHDLDLGLPDAIGDSFDLIALFRYVDLDLLPQLARRLRPEGMLIVEEHLQTEEAVAGPKSAEFRVAPGVLKGRLPGLRIMHEFEGLVTDPDGARVALSQIVVKPQ